MRTDFDVFDIDPNIVSLQKITFMKSIISIDKGLLLTEEVKKEYVYNYRILNELYTK